MVGQLHDGCVVAVEYEVDVGDAAGIPADELQYAPQGEHVSCLKRSAVTLDVDSPGEHHQPEGGELSSSPHHLLCDAGGLPRSEIFVHPAEVVRAGRGRLGHRRDSRRRRRWGQ